MPLKPHPTDPDKIVYASPHYDLPDTPTARAYLAKVLDDDDDIQTYQRPWVGLTEWEREAIAHACGAMGSEWLVFIEAVEKALKEKNR